VSFNEGLVWTRAHEDVRGPAEEGLSQLGGDYRREVATSRNYSSSSAGRVRPRWAVTPNERWRPDKLKHVGHWNNFLGIPQSGRVAERHIRSTSILEPSDAPARLVVGPHCRMSGLTLEVDLIVG